MDYLEELVKRVFPYKMSGSVKQIVGHVATAGGFPAPLGALSLIERECGPPVEAEVVGFNEADTLLLSSGDLEGVRSGSRVKLLCSSVGIRLGEGLVGRVLNSRGQPVDHKPLPPLLQRRGLSHVPPSPLARPPIDAPLETGIKAIDSLLTVGAGQRLGIFAGSGVGKSTLLGQMARGSTADLNVIALVGERGREVREFLDRDLGPEGLARSIVVVATSDEPALQRLRAALAATTIAEFFRDQGQHVLFMMDSVTRFAAAQREIGLAANEPPVTRGYPPSVFSALPRLLERSGRSERGTITGIYTVLVEGDDMNDPIADTVRGILDGHVVLSRKLAHQSHWPAIDVLSSISRLMNSVVTEEHRQAADRLRELLAAHAESSDLIMIGAYQRGANPLVDKAIQLKEPIQHFLRQRASDHQPFTESVKQLITLANLAGQPGNPQ